MKESMMLEFPLSEYRDRIDRFRAEMERMGLDAVIFTTRENTRYFSGFRSIVWDSKISKPGALVLTADGDLTLVCIGSGTETAAATSCVEDIRSWARIGSDKKTRSYSEAIFDVLRGRGLAAGRIGMELGLGFRLHLTHDDYKGLMALLSDATVVDAGPAIWALRMIKSAAEIELCREVCRINVRGFEHALSHIRPGDSEHDLFRLLAIGMYQQGANQVFPMGVRAGKERYSQGNSPPGDRAIGHGEIILMDGGPEYRGYYSDIIREAVFGEPSPRQRELFTCAMEACEYGVSLVRPGVSVAEIARKIDRFVDQSRFAANYVGRGGAGHGLGLDIHEPPMVDVKTDLVLVPGMVLAIEPSLYEAGSGMFGIEENLLVTETGHEILTSLNHDLWVLPA